MLAYSYDPMLWPTLGSAAFMGALALYVWPRRSDTKGALQLALAGVVLLLWCLGAAAEVAANDAAAQGFWFRFRDAVLLPGVAVILWFALEYAGLERWLARPVVVALVVVTAVPFALDFIDGGRLVWQRIWLDQAIRGDRTTLGIVLADVTIAIFLLTTAVFLYLFVRSPAHRLPVAIILVGQVVARIVYPLMAFSAASVSNIVTGVIGFDFVALTYGVALLGFRLLDLLPVARETILARMPDAMLVLDARGRVVDLNEAAMRLLGRERRAAIDQPAAGLLADAPALAGAVAAADGAAEVAFDADDGPRTLEVSGTPLADWQGRPVGRLVLLHDITALRRVEAQLMERERALAVVGERERLARELHDGLAQELWLAKLKATRLAAQPGLNAEARELSDEVVAAVDAGIAEAREAVATMRAPSVAAGSLRELLARTLEDFEDRFGLAVECDCAPELPALPARAEVEALRIVGEALTNVRRHADATVVRVRGGVDDGHLVLEVRDNGRGFEPGSVGPGTYGLAGMRERAAQIGAELEIDSAVRQGTRVRLRVPVAAAAAVVAGAA